ESTAISGTGLSAAGVENVRAPAPEPMVPGCRLSGRAGELARELTILRGSSASLAWQARRRAVRVGGMDPAIAPRRLDRTWGLAAGLALGPASVIGLARFAYALVLPGMRDDLGWSYAQAGTLGTANGVGYLLGAIVAAPVAARTGVRRAFVVGLVLNAIAL